MQNIDNLLLKYWKYKQFRHLQKDIIKKVINKEDTLALLPTGGGKSLCFQLPAIAMEGVCIVISPLIALMQDQVTTLKSLGIISAYINSTLRKREIDIILDNCIYGKTKLLYVSPERLKSELFIERFKKMNISFIAVDEAHCISQWGYDFRPSYLNIAELRKIKSNISFIALTATATPKVVIDIQDKLLFKKHNTIQKSFYRHNLSYIVMRTENKLEVLRNNLTKQNESSIIYVRSRRKSIEISEYLNKRGYNSTYYHAGINNKQRQKIQEQWIKNKTDIIVATNAFGMGIDKADVRIVINYDLPESLEAYFQEAGRAGRDNQKASSILLINEYDKNELKRRVSLSYPSLEIIRKVYKKFYNLHHIHINTALGESFSIDLEQLIIKNEIGKAQVYHSLKILELSGHILISENKFKSSQIKIELDTRNLRLFIENSPKYNNIIQTLLRSYSGLFDSLCNIDEREIAKRIDIDINTIKNILLELDRLNVISYVSNNQDTKITFLEPRIDVDRLFIKKEIYEDRKENDFEKVDAIIHYAYNNDKCRNIILLNYFGEDYNNNCGTCDVCISMKSKNIILNDEDIIIAIKNKLYKQNLEVSKLITELNYKNKNEQINQLIREMLDNNILKMNDLNEICLVS